MRSDEYYMKRALALARRGQGFVSPNPMVGAVVVSPDGRILSEDYHPRYGDLHAERRALEKIDYRAEGCTLYVNLEPCCHYGKTPPCTEAIIRSGVKRVVVGVLDPNPAVSGKGVRILEEHGIEVRVGVCEDLCHRLNRGFFKWVRTKRPYVILKWAQSIDGRIATESGDSKWISCPVALRHAHRLRAFADAVLVGSGTVMVDDPLLTVRLVRGRNPLRVVLDGDLSLPLDRRIFSVPPATLVFSVRGDDGKVRELERRGVEVVFVPEADGGVDLDEVLRLLGERGVTNLLVEGGSKIHASFIRRGLFDEVQVIISPKIVGRGIGAVSLSGIGRIDESVRLKPVSLRRLGEDVLFVLQPL